MSSEHVHVGTVCMCPCESVYSHECAQGPLHTSVGATLKDGATCLPSELESPQSPSPSAAAPWLWELPVHRVPVSPEPPRGLVLRKGQHVEEVRGDEFWGGRPGGLIAGRNPWARGASGPHQCPAGRVLAQGLRRLGCNALRPHQAEPHARPQASGFRSPHFRPNLHPDLLRGSA